MILSYSTVSFRQLYPHIGHNLTCELEGVKEDGVYTIVKDCFIHCVTCDQSIVVVENDEGGKIHTHDGKSGYDVEHIEIIPENNEE